ncbi:sugar transferase [Macellibacteroides fermentans]|uniref:Lipopolysaccharide/colanic/teichoic acid biosynthesis glycosyltransferase n=1 Tax=Macellibacteroides fermentans TaxID=879969 RepID=A0A8E2A202_9PORP|nr:sugar transferase [Macellibacteroides fermentans]NYI50806.1 lipopolysaccharide/colanic/teichoic acid biosynthesis glycosyltransferase [Macellibacteroides fermentans]
MYPLIIKRFIDFAISLIALIILSPLLLVVSLILLFANKGAGVIFFQSRPGMNEKIFNVIKFKSMTEVRDNEGNLLPNDKRITPVGKFIRKTSIDELPQLINVLKGDMSLIGPRPLLIDYLPLYSNDQKKRHNVRPGITGWAQINGRNAISWTQKFELDIWYVENMSFKLDIKIILLTILKVIKSENINQTKEVTMYKFNGKN